MIKSFAIEIISISWRKKADVIQDKHSHWRDVDKTIISRFTIIFWLVFTRITWQIVSRFFLKSDWRSESWTWEVKHRRFDAVFLLRTRCCNASVFRSYSPWRGSTWLLTRSSDSHGRNTKTKVLIQNKSFSFAGVDDVMVKTRNSCLR